MNLILFDLGGTLIDDPFVRIKGLRKGLSVRSTLLTNNIDHRNGARISNRDNGGINNITLLSSGGNNPLC